jgi:hypothetical protein
MTGGAPGVGEHEVLDGDQLEAAVALRLVDQNGRLPKSIWVPSPLGRGDGGLVMPSRSGRKKWMPSRRASQDDPSWRRCRRGPTDRGYSLPRARRSHRGTDRSRGAPRRGLAHRRRG